MSIVPSAEPPAGEPLRLVLEFARAEQAGDPYAFRFASQDYLVRSEGGGFETARLTWDQDLLADLAAVRLPGCDPALVQRVGDSLRRFLAAAGWAEFETAILAAQEAERQPQQQPRRVLVTVTSAAAELYALPWELSTLKRTGQHLGELPSVLFRYQWPEARAASARPARAAPERILVAWSAAAGAVPATEHLAAIQSACAAGSHPFDAQSDVLPNASYGRLQQILAHAQQQERPIAVLHLLCHGSALGSTYGLALHGEESQPGPVIVDAGRLRQLLSPYAAMLRLVVLSACDSGNSGALGNHLGSIAQTLHRAGVAAVVASRYPLSVAGSIQLTQVLYHELLARPVSLESALLAARSRLLQDAQQRDWASVQLYVHSAEGEDTRPLQLRPFRGLLAFQAQHRRFFFGRDREIDAICQGLEALGAAGKPRFLVVAGASGTGKSSVVLAGAVTRLLASAEGARFAQLRPGAEPEAALTRALAEAESQEAASAPPLLVVDQLEELFTHTQDPGLRERFARRLWQLASDASSRVRVIVTLRVDYMGRCGELKLDDAGLRLDAVAYGEAHRVFISQMSPDALRAAIEQPAHTVGLVCQPGLAQRMISDVGGEPGALPLLEDTLDLLWQRRSGRTLTQAAYDEVGGVAGALHRRADVLIDGLPAAEQDTARRLLLRLINIAEDIALSTRRRVPLLQLRPSDAPAAERFERVLSALVEARLLVRDGEGSTQMVEVAHEALIRKWQRLHAWVREDRHMLRELEKIELWVRQYEDAQALLFGSQLERAAQFQKDHPQDFPPKAAALLAASRDRVQRRQRTRRWTQRVVLLAAMGFALLGWFGLHQAQRASSEARSARDVLRMAAVRKVARVPSLQATLLREFEADDLDAVPEWRSAAAAVLRDMARRRTTWQVKLPAPADTMALSPDCVHLATLMRKDLTVTVWEKERASATLRLPDRSSPLRVVALSRDARTLLVVWGDQVAELLSVDQTMPPRTLPGVVANVVAAGYTADGARIWMVDGSGRARTWDSDGKSAPVLSFELGSEAESHVSIRDADYVLATVGGSGETVSLHSERVGRVLLFDHDTRNEAATLCAEKNLLATASTTGSVYVWELGQPPLLAGLLPLPLARAGRASFSPNGKRLLVLSLDRIAQLWNADGSGSPSVLHGIGMAAGRFSSDSRKLLLGTPSGQLLVWSTDGGATPVDMGAGSMGTFSPDGMKLAKVNHEGYVEVRSTDTGERLYQLPGQVSKVSNVLYSPDGSKIAAILDGHEVKVWDSGGKAAPITVAVGSAERFAFSADSKQLLGVSSAMPLLGWELASDSAARSLGGPLPHGASLGPSGIHVYAELEHGLWVAAISEPGRSIVLPVAGTPMGRRGAHGWTRDESRVLVVSADGDIDRVTLWRSDGSGAPQPLPLESKHAWSTALSPDGRTAVTIGEDSVATLWNLDRLSEISGEIQRSQLWHSGAPCGWPLEMESVLRLSLASETWDIANCTTLHPLEDELQDRTRPAKAEQDYRQQLKRFRARQRSWFRGTGWFTPNRQSWVLLSLTSLL